MESRVPGDFPFAAEALLAAYVGAQALGALSFAVYQRDSIQSYGTTSYLQPQAATFSIWGLIYLSQFIFSVLQCFYLPIREDKRVKKARLFIIVAFFLGPIWEFVNGAAVRHQISSEWMAVITLFAYGFYLKKSYDILSCTETKQSLTYRRFVIAPISFNMAWVLVASFVDLGNAVIDLDYVQKQASAVGGPDWAIGIAFLATLVAFHLLITKQDTYFAFVICWALYGVAQNQTKGKGNFDGVQNETVGKAAYLCLGLLTVLTLVTSIVGHCVRPREETVESLLEEIREDVEAVAGKEQP